MSPTADILLVDDDPSAIHFMARVLAGEGHLRFATHGADALRQARAAPPDLILLDAEMPGMNGFEVCAALKAEPTLTDVPVIFVTSHRNEEFELAGFAAGGADFITKPVNPQLLLVRSQSQLRTKRMADELRHSANIDALTGVANRRRLDHALELEWLRARRSREPLSLVLLDIDHFKLFNDHYGHPAGDACLRSVAQALCAACLRPADLVARYGGEEFALILPQTPLQGAECVVARVFESVHDAKITHAASPLASQVTLSAGISCFDPSSGFSHSSAEVAAAGAKQYLQTLTQAADKALYAAKSSGRARACAMPLHGPTPRALRDSTRDCSEPPA